MKNSNMANIEELELNEMMNVRGGAGDDNIKTDDGRDGDVIIWQ